MYKGSEESLRVRELNLMAMETNEIQHYEYRLSMIENEKLELLNNINDLRMRLNEVESEFESYKSSTELKMHSVDYQRDTEMIFLKGRVVALERERDELLGALARLKDNFYILHKDERIVIGDENYEQYFTRI